MSSGPTLSSEQRAAVDCRDPKQVIAAAADSGKTRVLVERYLKHVIEDGYGADQILTITFTRKAAAEMKRRIVDRLTAEDLFEQAQVAETGPIQTIHGFCDRMLRENAFLAGIDPEFEILAEAEANGLMEQAINETLALPWGDYPEAEALVQGLAGQLSYETESSRGAQLNKLIRDAIQGWRGSGVSIAELAELHRDPAGLLAYWQSKMLEEVPEGVRKQFMEDESGSPFGKKLADAFKAVGSTWPTKVTSHLEADERSTRDACGLTQLVCHAWSRYEALMLSLQRLDFSMLESLALQLLNTSDEAKSRIQRQYLVMLVDESQDLNPVQHRLCEALEIQIETFVGDSQQSIYGFRQADRVLFEAMEQKSSCLRLTKNYRSTNGILQFVDVLFGAMWDPYLPMAPDPASACQGVEYWPLKSKDISQTADWIEELVEECLFNGGQAGDISVLVRYSKYGRDLQRSLAQRGIAARLVGGTEMFFSRMEVRDLANALEALTNPYDDFALAAVLRSPMVGLSLDSIVALARSKPIIESLKLFDPAIESDRELVREFRKWFEPLSQFADRMSAWELIANLFAKTPFLENLARRQEGYQGLANVRKLLTLATSQPEVGPREYAAQIREIQSMRHKEGDAPVTDQSSSEVTIMTIHKSKGLEFPIVVVPDVHKPMSRPSSEIEVDPWMRMMTTKFDDHPSMFHNWLVGRRQERENSEEMRVFYVALTRAKERLCVVIDEGAGRGVGAKIKDPLGYKQGPLPGVRVRSRQR